MELAEKIILVTGSARGIGAATAKLAHKRGAKVILHGRTQTPELQDLAKELSAPWIAFDVADQKAVHNAIGEVLAEHKRIDVLVNSAGVVRPKPFLDLTEDDFLGEFKINALGTAYVCQAVIPAMRQQKYGRIVNVSSIRGLTEAAASRGIPYSMSKAAVVSLTNALAKEHAPDVAVNCVAPGYTETDMASTWSEGVWQQARRCLKGRTARPDEIAEAILFLGSDRAVYITGQTLIVDGGYTIAWK